MMMKHLESHVKMVILKGQPILVPEQRAQRHGNLPMLIPFSARRKGPGIAQDVAPFLYEVIETVKLVIGRRECGFRHDAPPGN